MGSIRSDPLATSGYTRFVANHEGAVSPDSRTYKGFMELLGRNLKGCLSKDKTPILSILDGMGRDLDAGIA